MMRFKFISTLTTKTLITAALIAGLATFGLSGCMTNYKEGDITPMSLKTRSHGPSLRPGQSLKLMTWNIQFFAGNENNHFFFSGGKDKWPAKETYPIIGREIVKMITRINPDVVLLQEVHDKHSASFLMSQPDFMMRHLPHTYRYISCGDIMKGSFSPHPAFFGPVGVYMCTISKYKIKHALRHQPPKKGGMLSYFFGSRGLLQTSLPIQNGKALNIYNVHLEYNPGKSDIKHREIAMLKKLAKHDRDANRYSIFGGDFNMLAPTAPRAHLMKIERGSEKDRHALTPMYEHHHGIPSRKDLGGKDWRKWTTFPQKFREDNIDSSLWNVLIRPAFTAKHRKKAIDLSSPYKPLLYVKTIDFFFVDKQMKVLNYHVRRHDTKRLSDHLPLIANIQVPRR